MSLDHDGRDLLAALQAEFGPDFYAEVPDQVGTDDQRRLELTIDCACRVVGVHVLDLGALRSPASLAAAVVAAFAAADEARAITSAARSSHHADLAREGAALLRGEITLRVDPRSDAERQRVALSGVSPVTLDRIGRSGNGFLAVRIGPDGRPIALDVDESWLSAAPPERLRAALLEAFGEASRSAGSLEMI